MAFVTKGQKELKRKWPHVSGLELIDKHEGRKTTLIPILGSTVFRRSKTGM